jgi:hypothetical protein
MVREESDHHRSPSRRVGKEPSSMASDANHARTLPVQLPVQLLDDMGWLKPA